MYDDVASLTDQSTLYGMKLCNAVQSQRCIYDPQSVGYRVKNVNNAAWKEVAKQCKDTAANCRFRWKTTRNAFTRSYKKYGDKSEYYLYSHLVFLIPFLEANHDKNDESINEDVNKSQIEIEQNENNGFSDSETTKSADESQKNNAILQNIMKDAEQDKEEEQKDHSEQRNILFLGNVIDLDKDEEPEANDSQQQQDRPESQCEKTPDNHKIHFDNNVIVLDAETNDSQPSLSDENSGRRLRDRKTPKRFIDMDFSPERSTEKRPRRIMQRRKSVGGLVLKEFALRNSLPDFPYASTNETFSRPKPKLTPETLSYCDTTVDDLNLFKHNTNNTNSKIYSQDASALAKPIMIDSFTTMTGTRAETVCVATQYEAGPRRPDDEFLDSLKPQMDIMNLRQKVHFKRRVYVALMEVLDDATNFPNDNEIVETAAAVAADFKATTSSELKLMRELVSIVQAAKTTPELGDVGRNITPIATVAVPTMPTVTLPSAPISAPKVVSPPMQVMQTAEKQLTPPMVAHNLSPGRNMQQQTIATPAGGQMSGSNPLGIPRHVIQKAVKVAGSNGSTIMTHDGDKRRVYRIYPKNSTAAAPPQNGAQATTPNATQPSTFFVTPPNHTNRPTFNPPTNQNTNSPSKNRSAPFTPPPVTRVVTNNTMLPPSSNRSPVITNGVLRPNTMMTPPQSNGGVLTPGHGKVIQRRYSICGPAPARNAPISGQHRVSKPYTRTGVVNTQQLPPLQRIQQFPQQQEFRQHIAHQQTLRQTQGSSPLQQTTPAPNSAPATNQSNMLKLQLSKPVSLNSASNSFTPPKPPYKHIPAIYDNCRPRMAEPLPLPQPQPDPEPTVVQPDPVTERRNTNDNVSSGESAVMETAGTIAADNYGSFFIKPIKEEPED